MRKNFGVKPWFYPLPVLIVGSYDENGQADAMNAAWGGLYDANLVELCLSSGHKTTKNIKATEAFTVSFADAKNVAKCDYVGIVSANNTPDKMEKAGFTVTKSSFVNAPIIEELPMTLECRLKKVTEEGNIIGEIVNISVDDSIFDENGQIDVDKLQPIAFDPVKNDYRVIGEKVGNAFEDGNKMEEIKMEYITLNNGVKMPKVGFGVYQVTDQNECRQAVLDAIDVGYRLIDTAQAYGNEEAVGEAIKMSGVDRKDLFITTKVWISNYGYEKAKMSVEESLKKMQLDYLDLVLLHQPFNDYYGAYQALVDLYKEGKIKAIGVSNFYPDRLVDMAIFSEVTPAINQVEVNVFHQQKEAQVYNEKYGVQLEAWAPFAEGRNNMFSNPELKAIGEKYRKTVAQVILRWLVQRNIVPLSKSVKKSRMEENINIFDFELSKEDMDKISEMDKKESSFFSHYDPSIVEMIAGLHQ